MSKDQSSLLAETRSVGHPDMPEFVFEPDQVAAILAYLKSIQQRWEPPRPSPANAIGAKTHPHGLTCIGLPGYEDFPRASLI